MTRGIIYLFIFKNFYVNSTQKKTTPIITDCQTCTCQCVCKLLKIIKVHTTYTCEVEDG